MGATGQIFQISKFPDTLSFVIIPRMFWRNLTKIGLIYIPYKIAQSGCIPPKLECEILAHKGSQTTCPTPGDYLAPQNRRPVGQRDLLASLTIHQDFPGKETHCRHVFFISIAKRSVKEYEKLMSKVTKGKEKTRDKNGETAKCAEEQDKESTYSFQN